MKIDQSLKTTAVNKVKEVRAGKSSTLARRPHSDTVHDQVELTGDAARMRDLESRLAQLDITDPQKIEAIRQAIADGSFTVDSEVVADGMIKEALDLLGRMHR